MQSRSKRLQLLQPPQGDPAKAERHDKLGIMFSLLYNKTGQQRHLDSAVLHAQQAVDIFDNDNPDRIMVADRLGAWAHQQIHADRK